MSGVEEMRVALAQAKESIPRGAIEQAKQDFEQVAQLIAHATEGSASSDIVEGAGQAQQGIELMQQAHQLTQGLEQALDSYSSRL